jgi:NAD(P)-dependent dehydrogenase (short-subunit alcohol dehydrogenase family)
VSFDMQGRTVVVTGASSGIGAAAAVELARLGATVVAVGRDEQRLATVSERIRAANPGGAATTLRADFASLAEVRTLADELCERHAAIHVLVNNAGLVAGSRSLTVDGYETTIAVNHLAPFLLTNLLVDRLRESAPARIVTTSSDAHRSGHLELDDLNGERRWSPWSAYSKSKLANVLFTRALARRLEGADLTANCLHPGVIRTRLGRATRLPVRIGWRVVGLFFKAPQTGAATIVHLASSDEVAGVSGGYFVDSSEARPSIEAQDDDLAERLWVLSEQLVGLSSGHPS